MADIEDSAQPRGAYYEVRVFESGCVETRPESLHDLFNALAWLAFPKTKARINAMHAERIAHERGRRGRLRDLLTLFDEGGAIVACADGELLSLLRLRAQRVNRARNQLLARAGLTLNEDR